MEQIFQSYCLPVTWLMWLVSCDLWLVTCNMIIMRDLQEKELYFQVITLILLRYSINSRKAIIPNSEWQENDNSSWGSLPPHISVSLCYPIKALRHPFGQLTHLRKAALHCMRPSLSPSIVYRLRYPMPHSLTHSPSRWWITHRVNKQAVISHAHTPHRIVSRIFGTIRQACSSAQRRYHPSLHLSVQFRQQIIFPHHMPCFL
jgi:hypothetical protein